ncbi:hypothetical protein [uncultured Polaribacter sp.]|uniref:hypothetical protein n=1 Tax=uncultured Polaribacter sp. TaxID=174711 RepID=UPI0026026006|nr:hypothetical protein [uncultured Polaribacter sp.]
MGGIKSELIEFDLTKENCFVCGKPADTVEHLFPKWLQNKFNLWDQDITVSNQTNVKYRQLIIPACKKCNNVTYGQLEQKIKSNKADEKDIWRWANKLHFGLRLKDTFLEADRKNPGKKISDIYELNDALEQSRHYLHCITGEFSCYPDPFGSVFKFEFEEEQSFNFIHILQSSSIYICLGKVLYIVFVTDGQLMKKEASGIIEDYNSIISKDYKIQDVLFFYAKCVYYLEQHKYSNPIVFSGKGIAKIGSSTLRKTKPLDKEMFNAICERFGITWIDESTLK